MKKLFLYLLLSVATLPCMAQDTMPVHGAVPVGVTNTPPFYFGYFSYQAAFQAMPEYAIARQNLDELKVKYDNEMKRVESEFNKKYEEFLEGQKDFAPSILQKRQAELQDIMQKNMAFKQESKRLLKQAEAEIYKPLKEKLAQAIQQVGLENRLAFVLNTDENAVPYIDATMGVDITAAIANALR